VVQFPISSVIPSRNKRGTGERERKSLGISGTGFDEVATANVQVVNVIGPDPDIKRVVNPSRNNHSFQPPGPPSQSAMTLHAGSGLRPECANSSHSGSARLTGEIYPPCCFGSVPAAREGVPVQGAGPSGAAWAVSLGKRRPRQARGSLHCGGLRFESPQFPSGRTMCRGRPPPRSRSGNASFLWHHFQETEVRLLARAGLGPSSDIWTSLIGTFERYEARAPARFQPRPRSPKASQPWSVTATVSSSLMKPRRGCAIVVSIEMTMPDSSGRSAS
jgi:hypothetical protein